MHNKHTLINARKWVNSLSPTAIAAISERDVVALARELEASAKESEYNVVVALGDMSNDQAIVLWNIAHNANAARRDTTYTDSVRARTAADLMVELSDMMERSCAIEDAANKALREEHQARKLREEDGLEMGGPRPQDLWDVGPNSK